MRQQLVRMGAVLCCSRPCEASHKDEVLQALATFLHGRSINQSIYPEEKAGTSAHGTKYNQPQEKHIK